MEKCFMWIILLSNICAAQIDGGSVLHLDGQCDYVQLFEPIIKDIPFTMEVWTKTCGPGGGTYFQNPIYEQRTLKCVFNAPAVVMVYNDGRGHTAWTIRDYDHHYDSVTAPRPPINKWHHIAGVVTQERMFLYFDGELVNSVSNSQIGPFDKDYDHVAIGRHAYNDVVAGYLNGYIDELRIWNYARTQGEIKQDMFNALDMDNNDIRKRLLAYWNFDDDYDLWKNGFRWRGIQDMSGNNHHGALMGDAELVSTDPPFISLADFSLLDPFDGKTVQTACPLLKWQGATNIESPHPESILYDIYVDTQPSFSNPLIFQSRGKKTNVQAFPLVAGSTYYWKVRALNMNGERRWSTSMYSFVISVQGNQVVTLKDFSLISPGFDATVQTAQPTLYWEPATDNMIESSDDITYDIYYSESADFAFTQSVTTFGGTTWAKLPTLKSGTTYFWKVLAKNRAGEQKWSLNYSAMFISHNATDTNRTVSMPMTVELYQNYPNPFNPQTTIRFQLPGDGYAELSVYDRMGRIVKRLVQGHHPAGEYSIDWNGRDFYGQKLSSGVYLYQVRFHGADGIVQKCDKKMIMMK